MARERETAPEQQDAVEQQVAVTPIPPDIPDSHVTAGQFPYDDVKDSFTPEPPPEIP